MAKRSGWAPYSYRICGVSRRQSKHLEHVVVKCGRALSVGYRNGVNDAEHRRWHCARGTGTWEIAIPDSDALELVVRVLEKDLADPSFLEPPKKNGKHNPVEAALKDLDARKQRLTDALEAGALDALTYGERISALNDKVADLQGELSSIRLERDRASVRMAAVKSLSEGADKLPAFVLNAPAQKVNAQLRSFIKRVEVEDNGVKVVYE